MFGVMFSIGEFARLGGVPIRTLRHYDEIRLPFTRTAGPARPDRRTVTTRRS
jgi:DNA-binding transcriptional MerR regulator